MEEKIRDFLNGSPFAVVGASQNHDKYGNKVFRAYRQSDRKAYPVNPHATEVEGQKAYPDLAALPERVHGVSIITPPEVTEKVLSEGIEQGIRHFWLQPGAETGREDEIAAASGVEIISGGPCFLVTVGYRES